ncbi:protein kinase, putative [Leishmania guyanensis]
MQRGPPNSTKIASSASPPALPTSGVFIKKRTKQDTSPSTVGAATASAVPESTTRRGRHPSSSTRVIGKGPIKASSATPGRKGESALPQSNASSAITNTVTAHSLPSPTPFTSSSPLLPPAVNSAGAKRYALSIATAGSATKAPSVAVANLRGKGSAGSLPSAPATAPKPSSFTAKAASGKSASVGCRSRTASVIKMGGQRGSVAPHLPAVCSDRDVVAAAAKDRGSDDSEKSEESTPHLGSAITPIVALAFPIATRGESSNGSLAGVVTDMLPPLRLLASAESKLNHGAHSPTRPSLHKTLSSTASHHPSPHAPASYIKAPVDRVSPQALVMNPLSPTMIEASLPERKSSSGVTSSTKIGVDGAIGGWRAHCYAPTIPSHSAAAECEGGAGGGGVPAKGKTGNRLSKTPAQGVGSQRDGEPSSDEEGDDEDDSDEEDEESEEDDYDDGDTSDEDDENDDDSSADDDDDDDASMSASSSSLSTSTASTSAGDGKSWGKKRSSDKLKQHTAVVEKNAAVPSSPSECARWRGGPEPAAQLTRTKVSREGDVNVKVIFAVRSRHCFRRYVKEVMTRFGFQKATDFDMYCIDQYGDRVDIDTAEDFDQLLDAFTMTMTEGKEALGSSPCLHASSPPPPMSVAPLYHLCSGTQSTSGCRISSPVDGLNMNDHAHARAMSFSASYKNASSFYAARSFSLFPRLDATTTSFISTGGLVEDDGKSSGSVLRLYVRYSNAYYAEHRQEFQQQMQECPRYPQSVLSNGGSGTHWQQQLSLGSRSSKGQPQADLFPSSHVSPGETGFPFVRMLLASTGGSVSKGCGGVGNASSRDEFCAGYGQSEDWPGTSLESVSLQFSETLCSNLTKTFRLEEGQLVDWRRMSVLGKGSFGTVYEGITQDGKMLAVKVQELPLDDGEDAEAVKALKTEINLMRLLKHKNIVAYYGCQTRVLPTGNQQMEVFLELCHGGSLASLRRKFSKAKEPFSISLVRSYTRQVLEGLAYLHAQNVVHRDIKSDNVLISAMGEAKLADFGCSKRLGPVTLQAMSGAASPAPTPPETVVARTAMYQTIVGSPFFMAPEVLGEGGSYTGAADIWSVGCLVLEMLGREPWDITGTNIFQIMFRISREKGMPSGVPKKCPAVLLDFLERCFQRNAKQRATATELLAHEWVTCPDKALEEVPLSPLLKKEQLAG